MSWPPPGVDFSLNDDLLRDLDQQENCMASILDIVQDLDRLLDLRNQGPPVSTSSAVLAQAEDLAQRAAAFGDATQKMIAGKLCGEILLDQQRWAEALARLESVREQYAATVRTGGKAEYDNDADLLAAMARAARGLHDYRRASSYLGEAIADIERNRYRVNAPYTQSAYLSGRARIYADAVGVAFQLEDYQTMLWRAELSKARSLLRFQRGRQLARNHPTLLQFWSVCDRIREIDPAGTRNTYADSARDSGDTTLGSLLVERRQLWDLLAIERFGHAGAPEPFSLPALQRAIGPDTAILYYYWLEATVLLVTAIDEERSITATILPTEQERASLAFIVKIIRSAWPSLSGPDQEKFDRSIASCGALLPGRLRPLLEKKRRLLISPHHQLHLFPFHALPWDGKFLIETFAIGYIPNLSILLAPERPAAAGGSLVAGSGEFPAAFSVDTLPAIDEEVRSVADVSRHAGIPTDLLTGPRLTRQTLAAWDRSGKLETYACIHLATHGSSTLTKESADIPMEAYLLLQDGAWDGLEISTLRLNADLVVLSACSSGQRAISGRAMHELPGDEIFGIQSAFAMAGAGSVLGCLWPTDDAAASSIMIEFHRNRNPHGWPELALQAAVVNFVRRSEQRGCYVWAPFFLSILAPRPHPKNGD